MSKTVADQIAETLAEVGVTRIYGVVGRVTDLVELARSNVLR